MFLRLSRNLAVGWGLAATLCLCLVDALVACGAGSDGVGDGTAAALSTSPDGGSPAFQAYADLAKRHGVTPAPGRMLVIGIRGQDASGASHDTVVSHAFDDRLVALLPNHTVAALPMSTHPFETGVPGDAGVPDVDHDGVSDVGMIKPGFYSAQRRGSAQNIVGETTYHVLTPAGSDHIPAWRNTDHDRLYSAAEQQQSDARHDTATAILFHVGEGAGAPLVIGCQVLAAPDMHTLAALGGSAFDYLLVDANDEDVPPVPQP